jgi:hypothetical protein
MLERFILVPFLPLVDRVNQFSFTVYLSQFIGIGAIFATITIDRMPSAVNRY